MIGPAFPVPPVTDRSGPEPQSPACPGQDLVHPPMKPFPSMTLPMTRGDEHTMRLREGGVQAEAASPGPVPLHPHLFLMGW